MRIWGLFFLAFLLAGCAKGPAPAATPSPQQTAQAQAPRQFGTADEAVLAVYDQMTKGDFAEGARLSEIAVKQYPGNLKLLTNHGSCLFQLQKFEDAYHCFEKARPLAAPEGEWTLALQQARSAMELGQRSKAEELFAQATSLLKKDTNAAENFVEQLYRMRAKNLVNDLRYKESLPFFTKAMEYRKPNLSALMGRAVTYSLMGDDKNYQADLTAVAKLDPKAAAALKEAVKQSKAAVRPEDPALKEGLYHLRAGEFEKAIASLDKALEKNPKSAGAYRYKGSALQSLKRYKEAIDAYNSSYSLNKNEVALYNRALCYVKLDQIDKAEDDLRTFLTISTSPVEKEKAQKMLELIREAKATGYTSK